MRPMNSNTVKNRKKSKNSEKKLQARCACAWCSCKIWRCLNIPGGRGKKDKSKHEQCCFSNVYLRLESIIFFVTSSSNVKISPNLVSTSLHSSIFHHKKMIFFNLFSILNDVTIHSRAHLSPGAKPSRWDGLLLTWGDADIILRCDTTDIVTSHLDEP